MSDVCVITGGATGIGLAAAKCMPKEKILLISARTESKLQTAAAELTAMGYEAHYLPCDVSSRQDVHELAVFAKSFGTIKNMIHAAGMSPSMAEPEALIRVNAVGTKNINMEFSKYMEPGSVILDVASNSAYALPHIMIHHETYALAEQHEEEFVHKMVRESCIARTSYEKAGLAYALSKNFVIWYAQKCAFEYGKKGIRVVSASPGLIDTDMGKLEKQEGADLIGLSAEERMGRPEELGFALASIADERNGYLAGVDVLIDGGSTNGKRFKKKNN